MAGERIQLGVKARESAGSAESRRLRAAGMIPGVLYGSGKKAHPFVVEERELRRVLTGDHGLHAILDVVFDDQKTMHHAVLKDYQQHPLRGTITHVDFHEVRLDQPIQATVLIHLVGESPGSKQGGIVQLVSREVQLEALPTGVPEHVELDISALEVGVTLRIEDLAPIEGVTFLDDPQLVLATCTIPRGLTELEEEAAEGEGEEGAEGAEGEAAEASDEGAPAAED